MKVRFSIRDWLWLIVVLSVFFAWQMERHKFPKVDRGYLGMFDYLFGNTDAREDWFQ